jgi:DNA-binding GntR family transcriptional regulator
MPPDLPARAHENLSNTVYATLCASLIQGRFKPGERLKIRDIAAQLRTSVTPVRDAIIRLVQDDALVFQSARDIRIPSLGQVRYLEIRAIRLRLESLAAETAARLATPADLAALKTLLATNEQAMHQGDWLRAMECNQRFHFQLATIAQMPVLHATLQRLWLQMGPLIAAAYIAGGRDMIDHHYPVLDALTRHDGPAAAAAIMHDIEHGGQTILARLNP